MWARPVQLGPAAQVLEVDVTQARNQCCGARVGRGAPCAFGTRSCALGSISPTQVDAGWPWRDDARDVPKSCGGPWRHHHILHILYGTETGSSPIRRCTIGSKAQAASCGGTGSAYPDDAHFEHLERDLSWPHSDPAR